MSFEQVWLLLLFAPPVLWMIFASYQSSIAGRFAINIFGILRLLAFSLTGFVTRKSNVAVEALAQALTGLSDTILSKESFAFTLLRQITEGDLSKQQRSKLTT